MELTHCFAILALAASGIEANDMSCYIYGASRWWHRTFNGTYGVQNIQGGAGVDAIQNKTEVCGAENQVPSDTAATGCTYGIYNFNITYNTKPHTPRHHTYFGGKIHVGFCGRPTCADGVQHVDELLREKLAAIRVGLKKVEVVAQACTACTEKNCNVPPSRI